jgi:hypothetical protein
MDAKSCLRPVLYVSLIGSLISPACRSVDPTSAVQRSSANQSAGQQTNPENDFRGVKTNADIAKLSWVNKRCRLWAADVDIDIDQTCLVVKTVSGSWIVIPNEYVDQELQEIATQLGRPIKDKWLQRFYRMGGGEKPQK